ncbi:MAG TPA: CotH kinase family protein [Myxococcota bacterium]|nr:CotH kinase family protein [Myxococcota bacterium]
MLLFLVACEPTSPIILDPVGEDSPVTESTPVDTGDSTPTIDATVGRVEMSPKGGSFINQQEILLEVKDGAGDLYWCLSTPSQTDCTMEPYTGPILLEESGVVRAEVVQEGRHSDPVAATFVEVASALSGFQSNLPVLLLSSPGSEPDEDSDRALGMVLIEPPAGGVSSLVENVANDGRVRLRVRGSSSSGLDKKSWDVELWENDSNADRSDALLGMPANGDWILYAPYYFDEALIRNPLAFAVSETLGRYAPRSRFVEVFLAEQGRAIREEDYLGVYVLMEEIERAPDRVNITELLPTDVNLPELTGGYLFKIDRTADGESGLDGYTGTAGGLWEFEQGFVAVEPSEAEMVTVQKNYLENRLDALGEALASDDGTDPGTGLHYDEIMDSDSFIDHHIINIVMKNPDSFRLSAYMYQDRGGLIVAGPVWDFDRSADSQDDRSGDPTWWDAQNYTSDCTDVFAFGWYNPLFEDPVWSARYWARLDDLLQGDLSNDAMDALIDGLAAGLEEPAARDADRWGQAEFTGEISELKEWFHTRHDWMQACIAAYEDPRDCPGDGG